MIRDEGTKFFWDANEERNIPSLGVSYGEVPPVRFRGLLFFADLRWVCSNIQTIPNTGTRIARLTCYTPTA